MSEIVRRTMTCDGLNLSFLEVGSGVPVLYVHGALTTADEGLVALLPALPDGVRLIAVDRPGHGGSQADAAAGSCWRQASLIAAGLQRLEIEPVVVGHSFGGAVAMALALDRPETVRGVVALAPLGHPEIRMEQLLFAWRAPPLWGETASALMEPLDSLLLPALWGGMFAPQTMTPDFAARFPFDVARRPGELAANGREAAWMCADLTRSLAAYPSCRVPVRVMHGDRDAVADPRHGRLLASMVPDGRFRSLPGLGHMAHHFVPELVFEEIAALTAEVRSIRG